MPTDNKYRQQVALLIQMLPLVAEEPCFALKGGTAINLFIRDLPRLSVDIDLTYVPLKNAITRSATYRLHLNALPEKRQKQFPAHPCR